MSRPLLLVVDGESLKSPALVATLELDGWDIRWASNQEARHFIDWGLEPNLILLDPAHGGEASFEVAKLFLARLPGLPVLVLQGEETAPYANFPKVFKGYLSKDDAVQTWPSALRAYKPDLSRSSGRFSSEDIFGDLLADIEGETAPPAKDVKPRPEKASPPAPPAPVAPKAAAAAPAAPAAPVVPAPAPPRPATPKTAETKPVVPKIQLPKFLLPAPKAQPAPPAPAIPKITLNPASKAAVKPVSAVPSSSPSHSALSIPSPAATQAMKIEPFVPPPPAPPPPKAGLDSDDIFGGLLEELEGNAGGGIGAVLAQPAPDPEVRKPEAAPPVPQPPAAAAALVPEAPKLAAPPPPMAQDKSSEAVPKTGDQQDDEYTLSGISGIFDPFALEAEATGSASIAGPTIMDRPPAPLPPSLMGTQAFPDMSEPAPANVLEEYGNYYLLEKIAVGGMAELFKAKQRGVQGFQKIVAIKRILPHLSDNEEFVTMFIDEAKLAAQLTHPNIVQIFDLGKASGSYYIAMEYVDGKDLRSLLRKVREYRLPFPEPVAAFVTMKVAVALDHAHRKKALNDRELKLVHRDISPQNILISSDGAVKLVDFGIAKAATKNTQTLAGALKGKLLYMSPEQALGQPLDNRSDLYSLGLVLFELLTGERCFHADSELGVLEKVRMGRISDVQSINPSISREMAAIVNKCLQKNVEMRYPSARFLERDLKDLLVRQSSEPTDHDVAEYVNALLKGTKEQVEEVMSARFAVRVSDLALKKGTGMQSGELARTKLEDQPTTTAVVQKRAPAQIPIPLPELESMESTRSPWLVRAIVLLLIIIPVLIWIAWHA
ncbi:MAG: protein kinase [Holophagaceae bacterium]|nr:protein kinase [Holophagaceae bacterium]